MNAKEILDTAGRIIKRQDLDRALLLFFINTTRKALIRDNRIIKFQKYLTNISLINGNADLTPYNISSIKAVEWQVTDAVSGDIKKIRLDKLIGYSEAIDIYHSLDKIGIPKHYLSISNTLYVLNVPTEGTINIYGEVFPDNLVDDPLSTDIMTQEIGEALIYLGASEYFDMLGENQLGQYWRQKGSVIVTQYIKDLKLQETDDIELLYRDPFGATPRRTPTKVLYDTVTVDDLDAGGF